MGDMGGTELCTSSCCVIVVKKCDNRVACGMWASTHTVLSPYHTTVTIATTATSTTTTTATDMHGCSHSG